MKRAVDRTKHVDDDDYRWFEFVDRPLDQRFPFNWPWLAGASTWAEGAGTLRDPNPESARRWLEQIRQARKKKQAARCPRVFVSHRQSDDKQALRIAWLAQEEGWGYWLDLIDLNSSSTQQPNASQNWQGDALEKQLHALQKWLGQPPTHLQKSIFTAAIIEMGLLNCTHVIAAMTHNTKGSQWVPYEYGRVKEVTPVTMTVASWWDSTTLKIDQLPEYVHLAPVLEKETAIRGWLQSQMGQMKAKKQYPNCPGTHRDDWPQHIPKPGPLPTG
jgi:hypothetical protein